MVYVKIKDVHEKIDAMIAMVENGEAFVITKEGKPIAELLPLREEKPGWKRRIEKVKLPEGVSAQSFIEEERNL